MGLTGKPELRAVRGACLACDGAAKFGCVNGRTSNSSRDWTFRSSAAI
jgi:hypothetical protein